MNNGGATGCPTAHPKLWLVGQGHNAFDPARKISKIGVTSCQILWLKYTKFAFRWGFVRDHAGGASAPSRIPIGLYLYFRGLLLRGGKGKEWKGKE